jgi:transcriptional regulator with XRE-family HTH domain
MGRAVEVPITPSVLAWAIDQSGIEPSEVARSVDVDEAQLARWVRGNERPGLTAFKKLAQVLRRPSATFLLPRPPLVAEIRVEFRHPPGVADRDLSPDERLRIREVHRLQRTVGWLLDELGDQRPTLPIVKQSDAPEKVGERIRNLLGVTAAQQMSWPDTSAALREWRRRFEELGVLVFLLPMGPDGARGFSLWDDVAPAIVINTHWNTAARIYTLFHEFAQSPTARSDVPTPS